MARRRTVVQWRTHRKIPRRRIPLQVTVTRSSETLHEDTGDDAGSSTIEGGCKGSITEQGTCRVKASKTHSRCRGQSILEYLVITTVIVLAILGIRGLVGNQTNNLYNTAANKIGEAETSLQNFNTGAH